MKKTYRTLSGGVWMLQGAVLVISLAASGIQSQAQTYTIGAENTSLEVDLAGGLSDWTINGQNQLDQQWFYYSVGSGTINSVDTIAPWTTPSLTGSAPFGTIIQTNLTETYDGSAVNLTTEYTLNGQPSGSSGANLGTSITIQNSSGTNEVLHFYQYSDFTLGGTSGGQTVEGV